MADNVWVMIIDHRYGSDAEVYRTEELARAGLLEWVHTWWHEIAGMLEDQPHPPEGANEAIDTYFEANGREFYSLYEARVKDEYD